MTPPAGRESVVLGGRYRLGGLLGRGGMADVYRARDERLGRDVAVKVFRADSGIPQQDLRHRSEVRMLAALSHPGLVTILDAGKDPADSGDGRQFLVMELIDGTTLAHRLEHGPLPPTQVAEIGAQLAAALGYVHAQGIVHRDVKPANVLLTDPPAGHSDAVAVKLSDFGIARLLDDTRITTHGNTVGTANYLSPEQATGTDIGPPSDIYSLGLVLLECLTGHTAYPGQGVATAAARLHRPPDIPTALGPGWTQLLAAMTSLPPDARPTAEQTTATLRALAAVPAPTVATRVLDREMAPTAATTVLDRAMAPTRLLSGAPESAPKRRRWMLLAAAAALTALGLTAAIIALVNAGGHPRAASTAARSTESHPSAPATSHPSTPTQPTARSSSTVSSSTVRPSTVSPSTPAQAITNLRAAIAVAVRTGNLDLAAATDLDNRLDDISRSLSAPGGSKKAGKGPAGDAGHKVADLVQHLSDLVKGGQLTATGRQQLSAPLNELERLIPPQH